MELSADDKQQLLQLAGQSIDHGLAQQSIMAVDVHKLPGNLQQTASSFVTLSINGDLRGCIGALDAGRPLAQDVVDHAFEAAFRDPRFPALTHRERPVLAIEISVLSPQQKLPVDSEQALLDKLIPGQHGLTLQLGPKRATFLPAVWEQLPDPHQFVTQLKHKGGWPEDFWSDQLEVFVYETDSF